MTEAKLNVPSWMINPLPLGLQDSFQKQTMDMQLFGTHNRISCNGCLVKPIQGFRYKCKNCHDHDLCETCHGLFLKGTLKPKNKVGSRSEKHAFEIFKSPKPNRFQGLASETKTEAKNTSKKTQPNAECPCGSKKKYKKCCFSKTTLASAPSKSDSIALDM